MLNWFQRNLPCSGSVLFPGTLPPRVEEFDFLRERGVQVLRAAGRPGARWAMELFHPRWGKVWLICPREAPIPRTEVVDLDVTLAPREKAAFKMAGRAVTVNLPAAQFNVLRDRKNLLRFLHAVMGEHGLGAVDHVSQRSWSRAALEDELSHDADLDVEGLYTLHCVTTDENGPAVWLHSHGLKEIGFFDFDVLDPSPDLTRRASDVFRSLAFAIVGEDAKIDGPAVRLASADPGMELIAPKTFLSQTAADAYRGYREMVDDSHATGHGIACDARPRGFFSKLFRSKRPRPSRFLAGPTPEGALIFFSRSATAVMAERARKSYALFRRLSSELSEYQVKPLAKFGYRVDGGAEDDLEHLWFDVVAFKDDDMEAILLNKPARIARMTEGDRRIHPVESLTDWSILTPAGTITPRDASAHRLLAENREQFLASPRSPTPG